MKPLALLALLSWTATNPPRPNPRLGPDEVIKIVVQALRNNNTPVPNAGVFTVYQFSSPANHAVTGPYGHFLRLVKSTGFAPLLGDHPLEFRPIQVDGDHAKQTVRIRMDAQSAVVFRFTVSRQSGGPCRGCWMVDGVDH